MKKRIFSLLLIFAFIVSICGCSKVKESPPEDYTDYVVNKFADTDELLKNPGKGLVIRGECEPYFSDGYYDMCSVAYERFEWSAIEPSEGEYNWAIIDECIEKAAEKGMKFAFGIMNSNTTSETVFVTPEWVFDAGADGKVFNTSDYYTESHYSVCPNWSDKIFLEKLNNFVSALGEKYNGNENIAYIDIRSYGNWGEQHIYGLEDSGYSAISSEELKNNYITPYINAFPDTFLVNPCNAELYLNAYIWALTKGVTIRRDGIMGFSDGSECLLAYGTAPTVYEFAYSVEDYLENDAWDMEELSKYIENGKPSYLEFPYSAYLASASEFAEFANKIGYYFRLKNAYIPKNVSESSDLDLKLTFKNDGVAPLYENAILKIGVFDGENYLIKTFTSTENPQNWEPGKQASVKLSIENHGLSAGNYYLAVGMFSDESDTNPDYLFGSEGNNGNGWYSIGEITVTE